MGKTIQNDLAEQLRLQKESLSTLLNHMPAMTFTKDVETGVYLACNQAFAEYAHKETPEGVAGLTDYEIFDHSIAAHFVDDDQKALSMDKPYVFYEDVADAVGNPRQFQTTKLKFHDENGRLCLLGMSMDVTEMERVKKEREKAEAAYQEAYIRFSALNNNLIVLYLIDPETDQYSELISSSNFEKLQIEKQGENFFSMVDEKSLQMVHPDDQELFHSQVTKENIIGVIEQDGMFMLDFRMLRDGIPCYVRLKASQFESNGKATVIIGLLDEDSQIRREKKIVDDLSAARRLAIIDALTGVKNKYAYSEAEKRMDQRISEGAVSEFSVAVFDVNDLKQVNDSHGHDIGDACIKDACKLICTCFKHSPVFRIGGDEFAAILEGEDYAAQDELLERFEKQVLVNLNNDRTVVAFGCSRFRPQQDAGIRMVFERADAMMYKEKMLLKSLGAAAADDEAAESEHGPGFDEISTINVRRHILIVDDIDSNREVLGEFLSNDYDIIYAADGLEAMEVLRSHKDKIALVILDLYMPRMSGREVMTQMQVDEELMFIPVIFISVDPDAELDCLKIGAMDFIPKPYPDIEIIRARISKCIELAENRDLIRRTQRDKLTGLYNIDYFLRYVYRYDQHYNTAAFDAVVCNVNNFHSLNEQYGRQFGDLVLRSIGIGISKIARKTGGIGCRRETDTFLLYCPHQDDYEQHLKQFMENLFFEEETAGKVTMRFGIYANAQMEPDIEARFLRAKIAADGVADDPLKFYGVYE